jgi:glycosyltransferase involved in cell wall biosynthesis
VRILLVTPRFLPSTGGVETHVAEVGRRLSASGHEVTVLTTDRSGALPEAEKWHGVDIRRVRARPRQADYFFAPGVVGTIRQGAWDIVHVQSYHTLVAPLAMAAARWASLPYLVTFHGGGHSSRLRNSLRDVQLLALRPLLVRAEKLIAVAAFEIDFYGRRLSVPRERFVLIPNGADLPVAASPGHRKASNGRLIASVGRLERYKGHQHVIAAMPHVLEREPEARLWIAGSGPYRDELLALARRLGVEERVEVRAVDAADRSTMAEELSRTSVVVLASDFETNPLAALEAASLGCPLVVADNSGLRELADRGIARAVGNVADPTELATAILEELEHPRTQPQLDLPTWDECASKLAELYAQVVRRGA